MHWQASVVAELLLASMTVACGQRDTAAQHPANMQRDDLPGVASVEVKTRPILTKTNCAAMDREWNLAKSDEGDVTLSYVLKSGDVVHSATQSPVLNQQSIDYTLDEIRRLVDTCVESFAKPAVQRGNAGSFDTIDGLEEDAVGFRIVEASSNGPRTTERIYARVDDARAAVVTVIHDGEDEPSVRAAELLPTAVERARD